MATLTFYQRMAALVERMIRERGRPITFHKLSGTAADPAKPWRGAADPTVVTASDYTTFGAFVIPNTSIPTESRGLAFDWIDKDLLERTRHVCMVAAQGAPNLEDYDTITDSGTTWAIQWGQCLQPGAERLVYVFGVRE